MICLLNLSGCILLNFYIKPQHSKSLCVWYVCCILLNFYIKPQHSFNDFDPLASCILLNFYIKPQPTIVLAPISLVVSYWISTSNHNRRVQWMSRRVLYLIEFLHQTTTFSRVNLPAAWLYLIEFLHQTTTVTYWTTRRYGLYLIEFLHQTTTHHSRTLLRSSCILLNFYIKPQL